VRIGIVRVRQLAEKDDGRKTRDNARRELTTQLIMKTTEVISSAIVSDPDGFSLLARGRRTLIGQTGGERRNILKYERPPDAGVPHQERKSTERDRYILRRQSETETERIKREKEMEHERVKER
jgi:hypothetical protein